jgi:hypothetical protein
MSPWYLLTDWLKDCDLLNLIGAQQLPYFMYTKTNDNEYHQIFA